MARDDYYKIVYNILVYLYTCLKNGEDVKVEKLEFNSSLIMATNERYWEYILLHMYKDGYIDKLRTIKYNELGEKIVKLNEVEITPKGIDYLFDNNLRAKALKAAQTTLEIIKVL